MSNLFYIQSITIGRKCSPSLLKNLKHGTYQFVDPSVLPNDFYGKGISINAIVGCNGSGKSSLLDILYRIINNFGYQCLAPYVERRAAYHLFYIPELYADIRYHINGIDCCLACRGDYVTLVTNKDHYYFNIDDPIGKKAPKGYEVINNPNQKKRIQILTNCFYTIATNYSIQSFNSLDYQEEDAHRFIDKQSQGVESDGNWMDSLFHKNDGYLSPITLNPFRNRGVMNMRNEANLTNSRLSALLIHFREQNTKKKKTQQLLEGYELDQIIYQYDSNIIVNKLEQHRPQEEQENTKKIVLTGDFERTKSLERAYSQSDSFFRCILDEYKYTFPLTEGVKQDACVYLAYKTLSIAGTYPAFDEFLSIGDPWNIFRTIKEEQKKLLHKLILQINKEHSHITIKIQQTRNLLDNFDLLAQEDWHNFTERDYVLRLMEKEGNTSLEQKMTLLPPPIFNYQIWMIGVKEKRNESKSTSIARMSSGERQFLFLMSTLIYHIINIKSVPGHREHYRNINLVMDEVEICFHPEYQRTFIYNLISTLQRLNLTAHCSFNIWLTTHSPFILSDIPSSHVLYLKKGAPLLNGKRPKESFSANVNDILHQSFFLNNGFIGEFAKKKILTWVNKLTNLKSSLTEQEAQSLEKEIELVGDPLLKEQLQELLKEKTSNNV